MTPNLNDKLVTNDQGPDHHERIMLFTCYFTSSPTGFDSPWKLRVSSRLDRISQEGAEGALRLIRPLRKRAYTLVSVQESWLNGSPEVQDSLVAFPAGWPSRNQPAAADSGRPGTAPHRG